MLSIQDIEYIRTLQSLANEKGYVSFAIHDIDRSRIHALDKAEYVQALLGGVLLLPKGVDAVSAFDQREHEQHRKNAENTAKEKQQQTELRINERKNRRHDYLVAAFGAVVGALVTLFAEHFDEIVAFVKQLS